MTKSKKKTLCSTRSPASSSSSIDSGNPTRQLTIGLGQLYSDIQRNALLRPVKRARERPLYQATIGFQDTIQLVLKNKQIVMQKAESLGSESESAPSAASNNGGFDDDKNDYIIQEGEIWHGIFQVTKIIGKGSFGQVVEALDIGKKERVAIKIIKNRPSFTKQAFMEMRILRVLNTKDPKDTKNTVRMRDHFFHRNHLCIVYEMLSFNLYEVLRKGGFKGLPLSLVRKLASQVLTNLAFLSSPDVQVIHCDVKPENILLRDPRKSLLKVIDFGSSCFVNERAYTYIQSRFYRSPEVIMGMSYGTAIDMWSFGCLLMELLLGEPLFPGSSELDQMQQICSLLGVPPAEWIEKAGYERRQAVFRKEGRGRYSLAKSLQKDSEVTKEGKTKVIIDLVRTKMNELSTLSTHGPCLSEYFHFADLIERILVFDPEERLTPSEALLHPFTRSRSNQGVNTDLTSTPPPSVLVMN